MGVVRIGHGRTANRPGAGDVQPLQRVAATAAGDGGDVGEAGGQPAGCAVESGRAIGRQDGGDGVRALPT